MNDKILTIKKSTLVDIANEVRAKTGSTDKIKVKDLDDAVKELSGGGGGIVEVDVLPEPYLYTPVPNAGYVEKAYFNTSLSIDQVVAELEKLTYDDNDSSPLLVNDDVVIIAVLDNGLYGIFDVKTNTFYFASEDPSGKGQFPVGWVSGFNGEIEVNSEVLSGAENDKIANLFYLDKQPNPEFNTEAIYKLPDETLWIYEDGWKKLAKQKKVTIINDAGYELTFGVYPDCENLVSEDMRDFNGTINQVTLPENGTLELYVTASVAIYNTYSIGVHEDSLVNARAIPLDEFDDSNDQATVVTLTGDNAVIHIVGIEM